MSNAMQDQGPVVNKCLIANDEQMTLLSLTLQFEKCGYEVVQAINGHEAFERYSEDFSSF